MSYTVLSLAYVCAWRGFPVPSKLVKSYLEELLGPVTQMEHAEIEKWYACSEDPSILDPWRCFDGSIPPTNVISRALAMRSGNQCLIPTGVMNSRGGSRADECGQRLTIAYYRVRGLPWTPLKEGLTLEQQTVSTRGLAKSSDPPVTTLVRAGPGTGKTSTGIELARIAVQAGQAVLFLAFTNSAVTTLRRRVAADPYLGSRYRSEPFAAKNSERHDRRSVLLSTVDQMARAVLTGCTGRSVQTGLSFDAIVRNALAMITNNRHSLNVFIESAGIPKFDHIVVDEAQMLSDDRAAFIRAVVNGMTVSGINGLRSCHLTVFCDPKQTITPGAGQWLISLYEKAQSTSATSNSRSIQFDSRAWELLDLTRTFRFATQEMLDFVMHVSKARPALHVDLVPGNAVVPSMGPSAYARTVCDIALVAAEIQSFYRSTSSVGILTPTLGRTNKTSLQIQSLVLELQKLQVPICIHGDSKYQGNGVVITTFNSCAGMEFSHVFIFGAAAYPKNNAQIPAETGRSLMFVANSRAKYSICYVLDRLELCVDVDRERVQPYIDVMLDKYTLPEKYDPKLPKCWTGDILFREETGSTFMACNGILQHKYGIKNAFDPNATCPLYEALLALDSTGRIPVLLEAARSAASAGPKYEISPMAAHMQGIATRGRIVQMSDGSYLSDDDGHPYRFQAPPDAQTMSPRDLFYWYSNMRIEQVVDKGQERAQRLRNLLDQVLASLSPDGSVPIIKLCKHGVRQSPGTNVRESSSYMAYAPDAMVTIAGRTGYITYCADPYLAMYCAGLLQSPAARAFVVHVSPSAGTVKVFDGFHAKMYYLLDALKRTHIYHMTVIFKQNFLGISPSECPTINSYAIDTEFVNGSEIYEIGLLCMSHPFRSLCALVECPGLDAGALRRSNIDASEYAEIKVSLTDFAIDFVEQATQLSTEHCPRVFYFSSPVDISWGLSTGAEFIELTSRIGTQICKNGTFESDSKMPDLDSLYGVYVGPFELTGRHRAFPDAVALGEICNAAWKNILGL